MNKEIFKVAQKYNNSKDLLYDVYGISKDEQFDAFVIGTSWTPDKILKSDDVSIECVCRYSYFSSYRVKYKGLSLCWLQSACGSGNIIDTALCLTDSVVKKVIFVGAVGSLKSEIGLGEIATPKESYAFEGGSLYLSDTLDVRHWGKVIKPYNPDFIEKIIKEAARNDINVQKRKVFCTDSILCEYSHLDFIKSTGAELIEMETAGFYQCMELMGKDGIALLCVSDNSASNISLTSKTAKEVEIFHRAREGYISKLIEIVCKMSAH